MNKDNDLLPSDPRSRQNEKAGSDPYSLAHWCVSECRRCGLSLSVRDGRAWLSPRGAIPPEVAELVRRCRDAVVTVCDPADLPGQILANMRACQAGASAGYGQPRRWYTEVSVWALLYGREAVEGVLLQLERQGLVVAWEDRQGQRPVADRRVRAKA